jgi:hypothetical protein
MPAPAELPSIELLRELFDYADGFLYWRVNKGPKAQKGSRAGAVNTEGYWLVGINRKKYLAHRLIWVMHGNSPVALLDHINGDRLDNRIENLREADPGINMRNMRIRKDSTSGVKGVSQIRNTGRWTGQVWHKGQLYRTRLFDCKHECAAAVRKLRESLHGEFSRHE